MLCVQAVSTAALQASPAQIIIDSTGAHAFTISVRDARAEEITVRAEGILSEGTVLTIEEDEGRASIQGTITRPDDIPPGDHEQRIIIAPQQADTGVLRATSELAIPIIVRVPHPYAYFTLGVHASPDYERGDRSTVYVRVTNIGATPANATVIIYRTGLIPTDSQPKWILLGELGPGQTGNGEAVLRWRQEERLQVTVLGAQPLQENVTVDIGRPALKNLRATLATDDGPIATVRVTGNVEWNVPRAATFIVGDETRDVQVLHAFDELFYIERSTAELAPVAVPVTVRVGRSEQRISALAEPPVEPRLPKHVRWDIVLPLAALLLAGSLVLMWQILRSRR
jgi:hypothetical protein